MRFRSRLRSFARDKRAMSAVEFALASPIMISMVVSGTEVANYATVSMRVSQLALQVADNASRIGEGNPLSAKQITETQINDLLTGANLQAGNLNVNGSYQEKQLGTTATTNKAKARIIISSLETMASPPNATNKYYIHWQRCGGAMRNAQFPPQYGTAGQSSGTAMAGMGPTGRQVTVPDGGNAVIFVEVRYRYEPLFFNGFGLIPYQDVNAIASMLVRDDRDLSQIYNPTAETVANCT